MRAVHLINDNGTLRPADSLIHTAASATTLYGDGVFETIRWEGGGPLLWERHWARLSAGCTALRLPVPTAWNRDFFLREMARLAGTVPACRVRLQLYAGADAGPGVETATRFAISCGALPLRQTGGLRLGIATGAVKDPGPLAHLKTCNALPYRVAAREAAAAGWDDAVLLNSAGRVVETTRSNISLVIGGTMFVNSPAEGCIAGVMRAQVVEWMQEWSLPVTECSLTMDALWSADEIFLTNALRRVMPVALLAQTDGRPDRKLDIHYGEELARLVEQKFMALHR